jgi:predicted RND superfamily exporter protein
MAIVMTSLTTAAGLLSFSFADVTAITEMGVFSAAGVGLALLYTIIMLPALLAIAAIKPKVKRDTRLLYMDRVLLSFAHFSITYRNRIIVSSLVILGIATAFIFRLNFFHDVSRFFTDNMTVKKDLIFIDREFRGILTLEVVVDTKQENGIYNSDTLNRIEKLSHSIGEIKTADISVGKIFSINDILKEINQALHGNDKSYYAIPQDRKAIAQELLLFESSGLDDLERIVDSQFSKTRITIKTSWVGAILGDKFREYIQQQFGEAFKNEADITVTGMLALLARMLTAAIHSTAESYVIAFLVITVMIILLVWNAKIGLLIMIPNLLPIVFIMGLMGAAGIPLDMCSLMIGTIALGLVVDDTVHFIYNFQRFYHKTGDPKEAVRETLLGTGRAILITSLVLSAGFFILMCASLKHTVRFGFLSGLVIIIALLADFLLTPALVLLITRSNGRGTV